MKRVWCGGGEERVDSWLRVCDDGGGEPERRPSCHSVWRRSSGHNLAEWGDYVEPVVVLFVSHLMWFQILYEQEADHSVMNAVFGKLILDRIIAKLVEGRARDKQWRALFVLVDSRIAKHQGRDDSTAHSQNEGGSPVGALPHEK